MKSVESTYEYQCAHKVSALLVIEQDVDHDVVYIEELAAVSPEFHAESRDTRPNIIEEYNELHINLISRI